MPFDPSRYPDALTIGRVWRASPKARAELEANLDMLAVARQHPGQRLSPELRVIAVIREAVSATCETAVRRRSGRRPHIIGAGTDGLSAG